MRSQSGAKRTALQQLPSLLDREQLPSIDLQIHGRPRVNIDTSRELSCCDQAQQFQFTCSFKSFELVLLRTLTALRSRSQERSEHAIDNAPHKISILHVDPCRDCCYVESLLREQFVSYDVEGGEHSAPFECTFLTRDFGDIFGSSASTGGLHFHACILTSV
jgi:hypothetical protein